DGSVATRASSAKVINAIAPKLPELMGGSADLAPSTLTMKKDAGDFEAGSHQARNMHFGIREHGMGGILNGMALHGGVIPFGATFLIFSDYMRPAIRLAAIMERHLIYVFTHDSIGLGEDGPTHQPVEMMSTLRAIPNLVVIRPADANEVVEAWRVAIKHHHGPVALVLTRQKTLFLDRARFAPAAGVAQGGYVLSEAAAGPPRAILMASGSEVGLVVGAQEKLQAQGIPVRVVSVPSQELFTRQPQEYRDRVLPPAVKRRVAVEAAHPMAWYRWVGDEGTVVGVERYGASAPYQRIYQELGLTVENVVAKTLALIGEPPSRR
ncbi:MAG: transketolase, partial [Gemmatimonadetes bacterium]|nr:transketolase [Gemmatimonadota bacterium]